jgi:hypothetical protein
MKSTAATPPAAAAAAAAAFSLLVVAVVGLPNTLSAPRVTWVGGTAASAPLGDTGVQQPQQQQRILSIPASRSGGRRPPHRRRAGPNVEATPEATERRGLQTAQQFDTPVRAAFAAHGSAYYIRIGLGTPPQHVAVSLDTGSPELGVPASFCPGCAYAVGSYNPSLSRTGRPVPVSDPLCQPGTLMANVRCVMPLGTEAKASEMTPSLAQSWAPFDPRIGARYFPMVRVVTDKFSTYGGVYYQQAQNPYYGGLPLYFKPSGYGSPDLRMEFHATNGWCISDATAYATRLSVSFGSTTTIYNDPMATSMNVGPPLGEHTATTYTDKTFSLTVIAVDPSTDPTSLNCSAANYPGACVGSTHYIDGSGWDGPIFADTISFSAVSGETPVSVQTEFVAYDWEQGLMPTPPQNHFANSGDLSGILGLGHSVHTESLGIGFYHSATALDAILREHQLADAFGLCFDDRGSLSDTTATSSLDLGGADPKHYIGCDMFVFTLDSLTTMR